MKTRITPYAVGWLSSLVKWKICSEADALEAMRRESRDVVDKIKKPKKK